MNKDFPTIIKNKLEEKSRLFTAELGEHYQAILRKKEGLISPKGVKWSDIWFYKVERKKKEIKEVDETIQNLTKQLQEMATAPDFTEMFFYELRSTLMDEIELKERLMKELEDAEAVKKEKVEAELDVKHAMATYQVNRFEQALAWIDQCMSTENVHSVDMLRIQRFLDAARALETMMQLTPYTVDFDIAPDAEKYGIRFTSLQIGDVTLTPKTYTIRIDVTDCGGKIQSEVGVRNGGFDREQLDVEKIRAKFGDWNVSFEWFRDIDAELFIHSVFLRNQKSKDEKEAYICLSVHPYTKDAERKTGELEIRASFKPFPNSI